jgi:hypothetical protein
MWEFLLTRMNRPDRQQKGHATEDQEAQAMLDTYARTFMIATRTLPRDGATMPTRRTRRGRKLARVWAWLVH